MPLLNLLLLHPPLLQAPLCGNPLALAQDRGDALGRGIPLPADSFFLVRHAALAFSTWVVQFARHTGKY